MRELAATTQHEADFSRPVGPTTEAPVVGRTPRIARLLAFAHHVDQMIRDGQLEDLAAAAKWAGVTRARMSQITGLLLLAPAIQKEILALPPVTVGRDSITERTLRPIVAEPVWEQQIERWKAR